MLYQVKTKHRNKNMTQKNSKQTPTWTQSYSKYVIMGSHTASVLKKKAEMNLRKLPVKASHMFLLLFEGHSPQKPLQIITLS